MIKKILLTMFLSFFLFPLVASAEVWSETEAKGAWQGVWTKISGDEPGPMHFSGYQKNGSSMLTFDLTVYVIKNNNDGTEAVFAEKRNVSDGNDCNYSGIRNGNVVTGQYYCALMNADHNWSAIISK